MTENSDEKYRAELIQRAINNGSGGWYGKDGKWIQNKHCYVSCKKECDCQPPDGQTDLNFLYPRPKKIYKFD